MNQKQTKAAVEAMHQHSRFTYGGRFEGSLYQQKNRMIVFNTLLRKAIEPSKVHPYYIDAISSKYARIIEEADEVPEELMWQMLLEHSSHAIAAVAEEVGILDVNYFTKIFKKTLGVTPTRYRREHKEK